MRVARRHRIQIVLVLILSLLFQQLAMASYVCPIETGPRMAATAVMPCHQDAQDPRCGEHCNPHQQVPHDAAPLSVPMAAIPPSLAWFEPALAPRVPVVPERRPQGPGPPPTLWFCTLLI